MTQKASGISTRIVDCSTGIPAIAAGIPITRSMFRILAPMILPSPTFPYPFMIETTEVTSSGRDVPSAMKVTAITLSGTPSASAIRIPLSTRRLAPTYRSPAHTTRIRSCFQTTTFSSASPSSVPSPSAPALLIFR